MLEIPHLSLYEVFLKIYIVVIQNADLFLQTHFPRLGWPPWSLAWTIVRFVPPIWVRRSASTRSGPMEPLRRSHGWLGVTTLNLGGVSNSLGFCFKLRFNQAVNSSTQLLPRFLWPKNTLPGLGQSWGARLQIGGLRQIGHERWPCGPCGQCQIQCWGFGE